ncbi:phosphoadenosine phosphosulfate reductase domain-containing protein [Infirmifilum sp. NZ]|uniref:phosphoadenosine phosphosulfate reductase domain-containing protein n=1 Tax=Infirmifilum sp. NZ TaxID=2926850 RepID=UPI0027A83515|nr:phosphoadenosine phosphosulfate reductase family protein [Infirmifilum sp. NZ]UNQ72713.1 phosphoadenosine phosphosulfate reductase family protein [Infirmifilum sp. NZ]
MPNASVLKRISAKLYWDLKLNSPLAYKRGDLAVALSLTPPGDAWPVVGYFYKHVWGVIEDYFSKSGHRVDEVLQKRKVMLANKVMYPDYGVELALDAQVIGHVVYDIRRGTWRFRPLYMTVSRMVEEEVGFYAVTRLEKLARGFVLKQKHLERYVLPRGDEYVALATRDLSLLGVGVPLRNERIYVLKTWISRPYGILERDPDWWEVTRLHEEYLAEKEIEAISFLREIHKKYRLPVVVSFSGGKDSLVTLNLAVKAFGSEKIKVLFNDTGIEFPETVEYAHRICERMGVELIVADAGNAFWRGVSVMGPPARDFRWCCKVTKFAPTARALKNLFPSGVLSLVGQRKFESMQRALSPRVWRNTWLPNVVAASPIQDWTALDVWLYIFRERLLPNPLYYYGLDRLGCWLCPATEMGEFELAKRVNESLYSTWEKVLQEYASENSLGDYWVRYGLWRWVHPPKDILRALNLRETPVRRGARVTWKHSGKVMIFEVDKPRTKLSGDRFSNLLYTSRKARSSAKRIEVEHNKLIVEVSEASQDVEEELARVVIRAFYCVECLECANWCPTNAISLNPNGGITVDEERCLGCGMCQRKCPVAEYTLKLHGRLTSG